MSLCNPFGVMAREYWRWIDGQYTNSSAICDPAGGLLHGYGVFETIYFHQGKSHYLTEHLERLQKAAHFYNLAFNLSETELQSIIISLTEKSQLTEAKVRISLTASTCDYNSTLLPTRLLITADPYARITQHVSLVTAPTQQFGCPLQQYKSTSYSSYILAKKYATDLGVYDTLLSTSNGNYIECSTSNIFFAKNGEWFTPNLDQYGLAGIKRKVVLDAMGGLGILCSIQAINHLDFDFGIVTNSLIGIQIIEKIGNHHFTIGDSSYTKTIEQINGLLLG